MNFVDLEAKKMSRPEAAIKLGIGLACFDREFKAGRIPHLQIAKRPYFTDDLLNEYLRRSLVDGNQAPSAKAA